MEGGLAPPPDASDSIYPVTWEVFVDDVCIDGEVLPQSNLSSASDSEHSSSHALKYLPIVSSIRKLIDSGSIRRQYTNGLLSGGDPFPCSIPHTLAFVIGEQIFPLEPREGFLKRISQGSFWLFVRDTLT
jgi:hypothetical protein